jgi:hypothetical protein
MVNSLSLNLIYSIAREPKLAGAKIHCARDMPDMPQRFANGRPVEAA